MIRLTTPLLPFVNRTQKDARVQPYFDALVSQLRDQRASSDLQLCSIGVTSCRHGQGVSTVARNLASAFAQTLGLSTLLIDASEGDGGFAARFGVQAGPGLSEAIEHRSSASDCIQSTSLEKLSVMTGGEKRLAVSAFDAGRMGELLETLRSDYERIIVDMPRADELTHCFAMAGKLDGLVLVVEPESVSGEEAVRAKTRLLNADAKLLGVVMNKQR